MRARRRPGAGEAPAPCRFPRPRWARRRRQIAAASPCSQGRGARQPGFTMPPHHPWKQCTSQHALVERCKAAGPMAGEGAIPLAPMRLSTPEQGKHSVCQSACNQAGTGAHRPGPSSASPALGLPVRQQCSSIVLPQQQHRLLQQGVRQRLHAVLCCAALPGTAHSLHARACYWQDQLRCWGASAAPEAPLHTSVQALATVYHPTHRCALLCPPLDVSGATPTTYHIPPRLHSTCPTPRKHPPVHSPPNPCAPAFLPRSRALAPAPPRPPAAAVTPCASRGSNSAAALVAQSCARWMRCVETAAADPQGSQAIQTVGHTKHTASAPGGDAGPSPLRPALPLLGLLRLTWVLSALCLSPSRRRGPGQPHSAAACLYSSRRAS